MTIPQSVQSIPLNAGIDHDEQAGKMKLIMGQPVVHFKIIGTDPETP